MKKRFLLGIVAIMFLAFQYDTKTSLEPLSQNNHDSHIFFDVGHVLVKASIPTAVWEIGPKSIANYCWAHSYWNPKEIIALRKKLQVKLFDYMNHCTGLPTHNSITSHDQPLPGIMYNWITGKQDTEGMLDFLNNHPTAETFFSSTAERNLVLNSAIIFRPEIYVGIHKVIPEMVKLLQECLSKYPGQVYILSNWDESCDLLQKTFPQIFATIPDDHIIFSHNVGCAKPDFEIFDLIQNKFKLKKSQCILVDDGKENIDAIQKWGGLGILHKEPIATRAELKALLMN